MNKLRTEQLENLPVNKNRFDCSFEIDDSDFECEIEPEVSNIRVGTVYESIDRRRHAKSMAYEKIEKIMEEGYETFYMQEKEDCFRVVWFDGAERTSTIYKF